MSESWKIEDTAIAICNIYLTPSDNSSKEVPKILITKGQEFKVKDVKTIDCAALLDVGISRTKSEIVLYDCSVCKKKHMVKNDRDLNIYFPSIWFKKPEKNTLKERIKRAFKWKKKEDDSDKFLIPKNTPSKKQPPREIPRKFHEKERTRETVELKTII